MITALRSRNIRQILKNSNLVFSRYNANNKDTKAVVSEILQNDHCQQMHDSEILQNDHCQQMHDEDEKPSNENPKSVAQQIVSEYPEEPTTCCMSGCANCVWLDYAEKMRAYYCDGGEKAIKEINERVNDANMKAFLLQELRMRKC